jgi:hypothetical protein
MKFILKFYKKKMELRRIAKILGRSFSSIQYQLRKKKRKYKEL